MDSNLQQKIHEDRLRLGNQYAHVSGDDGTYDALPASSTRTFHDSDVPVRSVAKVDLGSIRRKVKDGGRLSRPRIEEIARDLLAQLWGIREELFTTERDVNPLALLDPFLALRCIGFRSDLVSTRSANTCGRGSTSRWLGSSTVPSGRYRSPTSSIHQFVSSPRRTSLGTPVLHDARGLHRDRALDGGELRRPRDRTEWEADVFATYFLMPKRRIRSAFEHALKTREFVLNEDTAFALNAGDLETLRATLPRGSGSIQTARAYNSLRRSSILLPRRTVRRFGRSNGHPSRGAEPHLPLGVCSIEKCCSRMDQGRGSPSYTSAATRRRSVRKARRPATLGMIGARRKKKPTGTPERTTRRRVAGQWRRSKPCDLPRR